MLRFFLTVSLFAGKTHKMRCMSLCRILVRKNFELLGKHRAADGRRPSRRDKIGPQMNRIEIFPSRLQNHPPQNFVSLQSGMHLVDLLQGNGLAHQGFDFFGRY